MLLRHGGLTGQLEVARATKGVRKAARRAVAEGRAMVFRASKSGHGHALFVLESKYSIFLVSDVSPVCK